METGKKSLMTGAADDENQPGDMPVTNGRIFCRIITDTDLKKTVIPQIAPTFSMMLNIGLPNGSPAHVLNFK